MTAGIEMASSPLDSSLVSHTVSSRPVRTRGTIEACCTCGWQIIGSDTASSARTVKANIDAHLRRHGAVASHRATV